MPQPDPVTTTATALGFVTDLASTVRGVRSLWARERTGPCGQMQHVLT